MTSPFQNISGIGAVLPLANINTDAIIPSPWLRTANGNLSKGLFGALRFDDEGRERDFILNRAPFREAKILFTDENFGCGSSREAAAWALRDFGISCVFAPSFADIFYENAFRNGILAGKIDNACLQAVLRLVESGASSPVFSVDLDGEAITGPEGSTWHFAIPASRKRALKKGADEIEMTLEHLSDITQFHAASRQNQPWLYHAVEGEGAAR